jgi:hypothetical protein
MPEDAVLQLKQASAEEFDKYARDLVILNSSYARIRLDEMQERIAELIQIAYDTGAYAQQRRSSW